MTKHGIKFGLTFGCARLVTWVSWSVSVGVITEVRNNNSSRFGKFIEMRFKAAYALDRPDFVGAYIETYLLEKVSEPSVSLHERCLRTCVS
eukprot:3080478-Amphidinium_carterae.1